jgi:hypothetical protein
MYSLQDIFDVSGWVRGQLADWSGIYYIQGLVFVKEEEGQSAHACSIKFFKKDFI